MSRLQKIVALSTTEADKNSADMLTKVVTVDKLKLCSASRKISESFLKL
ncbi:hypothetical protein ACJIZ3_014624 [Penstemon smallii]|uniref:Uncharacterized protein n=1 Tax=Penstemon smallii TaxID=265156 RepID=A0ABD3RRR4_9LAMI